MKILSSVVSATPSLKFVHLPPCQVYLVYLSLINRSWPFTAQHCGLTTGCALGQVSWELGCWSRPDRAEPLMAPNHQPLWGNSSMCLNRLDIAISRHNGQHSKHIVMSVDMYTHTHTHTIGENRVNWVWWKDENIPVTCTILETCVRANVHFTLAILTSVEGKYADWLLPFDQANTSTFLNSSTSHIFDYTQIKIQKGLTRLNMPAVTVFEGEAW